MINIEIESIIKKYDLVRRGDKIGTYKMGVNPAEFRAEVAPRKDEILNYMKAKEQEKADRLARRAATFDAIPGVEEIRDARKTRALWKQELNRMMETGDSVMRTGVLCITDEEMTNLEARYPQAVKALHIQYKAETTANLEMESIYKKAYDAICDGCDVDDVYATMESEIKAYTERNIWD